MLKNISRKFVFRGIVASFVLQIFGAVVWYLAFANFGDAVVRHKFFMLTIGCWMCFVMAQIFGGSLYFICHEKGWDRLVAFGFSVVSCVAWPNIMEFFQQYCQSDLSQISLGIMTLGVSFLVGGVVIGITWKEYKIKPKLA